MPKLTYNEELRDAMVSHQIGLLRYSASTRDAIWALLDATEADLKRIIMRARGLGVETPAQIGRLDDVLKRLRKARLRGWDEVKRTWLSEMAALSKAEVGFFNGIVTGILPVELSPAIPSASRLRFIVESKPFEGKTLGGWADDIARADIARIEAAVKVGLAQNETSAQIARRIVGTVSNRGRDGVTEITRRGAAAISRTAVSHVAAEARQAYQEANADIMPNKLFTATLDSRTTPICRANDGKVFKVDDPEAPVLPLHFGERSIYSPIADGEAVGERPRRDFTEKQLLREYSDQAGLGKRYTKRASLPRGHKKAYDAFARKRMRELTGRVPAKTTYGDWLKRQSAANQDDILGPTRGALFRRGGLSIDKFVDRDGAQLTLAQLAKRHASAFKRAGLNPADFR